MSPKFEPLTTALQKSDPEVFDCLLSESHRQSHNIELIASENFASMAVLAAQGSILTNKYAEGYPTRRWYGGCENADRIESLASARARSLFGAEHANVQPHSGSQANAAVYLALMNPGDCILSMSLPHGGHLTHGHPANFSGHLYQAVHYEVTPTSNLIDYDMVQTLAETHRPKILVAGASAYPRIIDFARFREIASSVGAYLLVDMSHVSGLVAGGVHPNPVPYADVVTSTTHKSLRGPRGGIILCRAPLSKKIDAAVFPGIQGGPLMHVIAAKAVCFGEASTPSFRKYTQQIVSNARALSSRLVHHGFRIITGGTDNHLILVDLRHSNLTGRQAQVALGLAGITVNKNAVPFDTAPIFETGGIRLGTPAVTTCGMLEPEMSRIADFIHEALASWDDPLTLEKLRHQVGKFVSRFPPPQGDLFIAP
jgi:glycine hydroxymethyltransferase